MSQISVNHLTFSYEGSFDTIFEDVSFRIDSDWKLGFIGRNGKGKSTFLQLLLGKHEYRGSISTNCIFDYFSYAVKQEDLQKTSAQLMEDWKCGVESWRVICELSELQVDCEVLYRPFETLSLGERTKVMLAVLFSSENDFLLIDEPTNHVDMETREVMKQYLAKKKGFILVSHDRDLLDACIDHVLVLNRATIEVQSGNFTSWFENKEKLDAFHQHENEKHQKEIRKLEAAADRMNRWAVKNENTKIGFDPLKEPERFIGTRSYIGAKTKKLQSRVKSYENRVNREIKEQEGLLQDIENPVDLKLTPLKHHKARLIEARDFSMKYVQGKSEVLQHLTFEINEGEIVFLHGVNGCGKSSLIRAILRESQLRQGVAKGNYTDFATDSRSDFLTEGTLSCAGNLVISYISQDTSHLKGSLKEYAGAQEIEYSLLLTLLRQLDFERVQFEKSMEEFSDGQKKKVLIAASLLKPANIYIWDEPLNYIDVFSRMQIERLIEQYQPTMLLVEHDVTFRKKLATKTICL